MKRSMIIPVFILLCLCLAVCCAESTGTDETAASEQDGYQLRRDPGTEEWIILSAGGSPAIWRCPECGGESDDAFCPWCGAKKPPISVVCTECGAEYALSSGFAFCKQCGAKLESDGRDAGQSDEAAKAEEELAMKQAMLDQMDQNLQMLQVRLADEQSALQGLAAQIRAMTGYRSTISSNIFVSMSHAGIQADVRENGDVVLDGALLFEAGKSTIRPEGQAFLDRFIPVYLSILLRDEYSDYLEGIVIEGHTDPDGACDANLKLSQTRALEVELYCLNMPGLTASQKARLEQILTATGRGKADPMYDAYGNADAAASRRIVIRFRLKDSELIEELNRLLADIGR